MGASPVKQSTWQLVLATSQDTLQNKFWIPTSYLTFPYGTGFVPAFILLILGALGFLQVIRQDDFARFAPAAYLLFFTAFMFVIGATNSYWGQDLSLIGVIGVAILLAGIDGIGPATQRLAERLQRRS
jgi:hypothetical protein